MRVIMQYPAALDRPPSLGTVSAVHDTAVTINWDDGARITYLHQEMGSIQDSLA